MDDCWAMILGFADSFTFVELDELSLPKLKRENHGTAGVVGCACPKAGLPKSSGCESDTSASIEVSSTGKSSSSRSKNHSSAARPSVLYEDETMLNVGVTSQAPSSSSADIQDGGLILVKQKSYI